MTSDLSVQERFIRSADVSKESFAASLFGSVFNVINKCQYGERSVVLFHSSALIIVGQHNGLQKLRIRNRTLRGATVGTWCQESHLNIF